MPDGAFDWIWIYRFIWGEVDTFPILGLSIYKHGMLLTRNIRYSFISFKKVLLFSSRVSSILFARFLFLGAFRPLLLWLWDLFWTVLCKLGITGPRELCRSSGRSSVRQLHFTPLSSENFPWTCHVNSSDRLVSYELFSLNFHRGFQCSFLCAFL